jgi:uncharacterized membrane protein
MNTSTNKRQEVKITRIGGYLHKITTILDSSGKVLYRSISPLMVELRPRDIMQMIVGATILAIPLGFTEETWKLGEQLPLRNVLYLTVLSLLFISLFVYYNFYRFHLKGRVFEYVKRVIATYFVSLIVVGVLLTIIDKCPWQTDYMLAIKRIIIVSFPASMSATIADVLK